DHTVEQRLHFARQYDVLHAYAVHTNAETRRLRHHVGFEETRESVTPFEQLVERHAPDVLTQRKLRREVHRVAHVRHLLGGERRVVHGVLHRERETQRDLVARHEILTRDGRFRTPH